jgi:hypothetical protein
MHVLYRGSGCTDGGGEKQPEGATLGLSVPASKHQQAIPGNQADLSRAQRWRQEALLAAQLQARVRHSLEQPPTFLAARSGATARTSQPRRGRPPQPARKIVEVCTGGAESEQVLDDVAEEVGRRWWRDVTERRRQRRFRDTKIVRDQVKSQTAAGPS